MEIYVLFLNEDFRWEKKENTLLQFVSNERKKVISSFRFIPDRLRSLYGALLVRMGIYRHAGILPDMQQFTHEFMVKPELICSEKNVSFNLSHSGACVVCGVSDHQLGIDTEQMILPFPNEVLSCFAPAERAECEQGSEAERANAFYRLWTRKEAYGKWNGLGLNQELAAIGTRKKGYQSWKDHAYMISVYSESNEKAEISRISAGDLADFYSSFI